MGILLGYPRLPRRWDAGDLGYHPHQPNAVIYPIINDCTPSYSSHKQHSLKLQIDVFLYMKGSDYDKFFMCTVNLSSNDLHVFFMDVDKFIYTFLCPC